MIVNVDEFLGKYASEEWEFGIFLGNELYFNLMGAKTAFIEIPDDSIERILQRKQLREYQDRDYLKISVHRYKGIEMEKENYLEEALDEYLKSIESGESSLFDVFHGYRYSYDRALALCRKFKMKAKEIELLQSLLKHELSEKDQLEYSNRLTKLSA